MRDPDYPDDQLIVVNFVNHPVVADTDTPQVIAPTSPSRLAVGVPRPGL